MEEEGGERTVSHATCQGRSEWFTSTSGYCFLHSPRNVPVEEQCRSTRLRSINRAFSSMIKTPQLQVRPVALHDEATVISAVLVKCPAQHR